MKHLKKFEDYTFQDVFGVKNEWKELSMEERQKLKKEIWHIVDHAYTPLGGHFRIKSPESVVTDKDLVFWDAINVDDDPHTDCVIFARRSPFGYKISGWGHDGGREAKNSLMKQLATLLSDKSRNIWIECAGAPAYILNTKFGLKPASKEIVEQLFDTPIEWLENGYYERELGENQKTDKEIVLGNPRLK